MGKTDEDRRLLQGFIGFYRFAEADYDLVLARVSEAGYWLETEGEPQ